MNLDRVQLTGFDLPSEEMEKIEKILEHYHKKISEQIEFEILEIDLKKSMKGKSFSHNIHGRLKTKGKMLTAEIVDYNAFKAVSEVLEKILHEAEHLKRSPRQV